MGGLRRTLQNEAEEHGIFVWSQTSDEGLGEFGERVRKLLLWLQDRCL